MKVWFWLLVILFLVWWYAKDPITYEKQLSQPISPKTTVIALDFHNVMVRTDISQMLRTFWYQFPGKAFLTFLTHPRAWYELIKVWWRNKSTEQAFERLEVRYPELSKLKLFLIKLIACQEPDNRALLLVRALKGGGYNIYLLSNIWKRALQEFLHKFPEFNTLFDGFYIPSADNNFVAKPHPAFYQGFQKYLDRQKQNNKQIIFIDNSVENVDNLRNSEMVGVLVNQ